MKYRHAVVSLWTDHERRRVYLWMAGRAVAGMEKLRLRGDAEPPGPCAPDSGATRPEFSVTNRSHPRHLQARESIYKTLLVGKRPLTNQGDGIRCVVQIGGRRGFENWHWSTQEKSLNLVASKFSQGCQLCLGFDPFCRDLEP